MSFDTDHIQQQSNGVTSLAADFGFYPSVKGIIIENTLVVDLTLAPQNPNTTGAADPQAFADFVAGWVNDALDSFYGVGNHTAATFTASVNAVTDYLTGNLITTTGVASLSNALPVPPLETQRSGGITIWYDSSALLVDIASTYLPKQIRLSAATQAAIDSIAAAVNVPETYVGNNIKTGTQY